MFKSKKTKIIENEEQQYYSNMRTDMADELGVDTMRSEHGNIKKSKVVVDGNLSKRIGKPVGTYITVQADAVLNSNKEKFKELVFALKDALLELGDMQDCLVVGLGNAYLTADALGSKAVQNIIVTRHFSDELDGSLGVVSAITPSVLGITGIESFDVIKGVVDRTKPKCIIAIDSLASSTIGRLATAFQVSNGGITPGSGVGNSRITLNHHNLGCPVYSIGVPLVVYISTILDEILHESNATIDEQKRNSIQELVVAPKDIDVLVANCASVVSQAINLSLHPKLDVEDLFKYV
ncbi:MAG: GPR endopeptidase [Firmicutes bacterium]|nr:GPR endopeptidase [Bacillota bacterium]MCL1954220.1 GPR endopeptidase [Bacillota bacterium]